MDTPPATNPYKNHRFPAEIISHTVWLYFRFCLSFRPLIKFPATTTATKAAMAKFCALWPFRGLG